MKYLGGKGWPIRPRISEKVEKDIILLNYLLLTQIKLWNGMIIFIVVSLLKN